MGKHKGLRDVNQKVRGIGSDHQCPWPRAFLGMVSLAIDMGQLYTVRNELQNVADAAALAAAGNLINDSGAGAVRDAAAAQQAATGRWSNARASFPD